MTLTAESIPGYKAGTWIVDPSHSEVSFSVRHLMISKVRGKFGSFSATILTSENPADTKITASAQVASIDTNDEGRDKHLRENDFFDAANHPNLRCDGRFRTCPKARLPPDGFALGPCFA